MEALGLREMLEPVPVKIRLAAVLPASLLFMTADWAAALMMVSSSPSRLATELARPVSVWVEAPVKRIRLTLPKFRLFRLPVVATSVPFLKVPVVAADWSKEPEPAAKEMLWLAPILAPPLTVSVWLTVSAPWLVVVIPLLPIVMALALPVPIWTRPVVPVELPTSMATLPEAKAPDVTLPDVMLMAEVAAPDTLVVSRLVMPAPCRLSVPEVVDRVELALPVKDTAPPVTVTPALPVRRALKLLAPAQVWAPVLTKPGLVMSAQLKLMVLLLMLAPLA